MDRLILSNIDEQLGCDDVAALCFLCSDVINRKRLEGIKDAKILFMRLEERGLLENNSFLSQLLNTIHRADLLDLLQTHNGPTEETDANPILSEYRVMLYNVYEDMTSENFDKMKYLLIDDLGRRPLEMSRTALDVFLEMEKAKLISKSNVQKLHELLQLFDQQLASTVHDYMEVSGRRHENPATPPDVSMDQQSSTKTRLSTPETGSSSVVDPDSQENERTPSSSDEYYSLVHDPRGLCVVFNNENFSGSELPNRPGTQKDADAVKSLFTRFGFQVVVHNNYTASAIRLQVQNLARRCYVNEDALVVFMLSHGDKGCIFGTDNKKFLLQELTGTFRSGRVPTLAGKPKLFFIQACQGTSYQTGTLPCPAPEKQEGSNEEGENHLQEDAGPVAGETVPSDADVLLGMATVPECKSFRSKVEGSIYIQELCKQLATSANSSGNDDILTVLTRVNGAVSKGIYNNYKQMPEPKYTLTKKLVLRFVK